MLRPAVLVNSVQGTNNQLRDAHAHTTNDQDFSTTPTIHEHYSWYRGKKVDDADHARRQQIDRVSGQSNLPKYLWGIVNDCIYTRELLDDLEKACDQESAVEISDSEELEILTHVLHEGGFDVVEASITCFLVEDRGSFDFKQFELEAKIIRRYTSEPNEGRKSFLLTAFYRKR